MVRLKQKVDKRREQLKVIEFAKLCLDQMKREKNCNELIKKIQDMKVKVRDMRLKVGILYNFIS